MRTDIQVSARGTRRSSLRRAVENEGPGPQTATMDACDFSRVLGEQPHLKDVGMQIIEGLEVLAETFGPPEREGTLVFWNFTGRDGSRGTVFGKDQSKTRQVVFSVASRSNAKALHGWIFDRLANVSNGDAAPLFLHAAKYEIRSVA